MRDVKASHAATARISVVAVSILALAALALAAALAPAAQASKNVVGFFGERPPTAEAVPADEAGGLFTSNIGGIAINDLGGGGGAGPGDIYLTDGGGIGNEFAPVARVQQYDSVGNFIRLFGSDVVLSGPDDTGANEHQTIEVPAGVTGGTFKVEVVTASGIGSIFANQLVITGVSVATGVFRVGDEIHSSPFSAFPPGTVITKVEGNTLTVSQPPLFGSGGGTLIAGETTGPINYDAAASTGVGGANLRASLEALPVIGAGNVTVTGGPGASGTPFDVTFSGGSLAHDDVDPMRLVSSTLTGGSAAVSTVAHGGGPESCEAASSPVDVCKRGGTAVKAAPGDLAFPGSIEVDPATGNIFVASGYGRIAVFGSNGSFQGAFGVGVATGAPQLEFCTTVCQAGTGEDDPARISASDLSIDPSTGDLFLTGRNRIQEFALALNGADEVVDADLVRLFGWDVVESGPDLAPAPDEVQKLQVKAESGFFRFSFNGSETGAIPATGASSAAEAEAELNALPTIGGLTPPASVTVTGGPANPSGSNPYQITFGGSLGGDDVPQLRVDGSGLVLGVGTPSATVTTHVGGGAFEVCNIAMNPTDICGAGSAGEHLGQFGVQRPGEELQIGPESVAIDSAGVVYTVDRYDATPLNTFGRVQAFTQSGSSYTPSIFDPSDLTTEAPEFIEIGAADHVFVSKRFAPGASTCPDGTTSVAENRLLEIDPAGSLLDTHMTCAKPESTRRFAVNKVTGDIAVAGSRRFGPSQGDTTTTVYFVGDTGPPTASIDSVNPNASGATIQGKVNPNGPTGIYPNPPTTTYQVEYKLSSDSTWTKWAKPIPAGFGFADVPVTINLGTLEGNRSYDVRLVANKSLGGGSDTTPPQTFMTDPVAPGVEALSSSDVTATSANLNASIHPHGDDTTYRFEYGTTTAYGSSAPAPDGQIAASTSPSTVSAHLDGLQSGIVYHFRVVATNSSGTTISKDQTFNFYPPPCPNERIRQQTGSAYLPDCRAYELVSPGDTATIILSVGGIPAPYASNPPRFSFRGSLGELPGTDPTNAGFNTYIATRTGTGWDSKYVGVKGYDGRRESELVGDLELDTFLNVRQEGLPGTNIPTHIPFVWDGNGEQIGRWPSDFSSIPGSEGFVGAFQPSPDFSHMAFSSRNVDFDPNGEGLTNAPGSAYDYDVEAGTTTLISRTADGHDIPQEPGNSTALDEFILFPGFNTFFGRPARIDPPVSTDGSHILMSTAGGPPVTDSFGFTKDAPTTLYMRVNGIISYDVSRGIPVDYLGMTADGSKVFFTTPSPLTGDDHDTSTDIFMWSEQGDTLTRLSSGAGAGDTDTCHADWIADCGAEGIVLYPQEQYGPDNTGNSVAADSGDIYFYSPELLTGPGEGLEDSRNLYVYRHGHLQFVTTIEQKAPVVGIITPIRAMQVSPDGDHVAFSTASKLTAYDTHGFLQMYTYDPNAGQITCVSCNPSGEPPTSDVRGSLGGRFMANDGRTFFSTRDALVPQDTNAITDVYEYVDGRAQLITAGTGAADSRIGASESAAGLISVSADGTDVYFSTYDTLISQDHNGQFLKFYDARTGGGFPTPPLSPPCEAADECRGASSEAPGALPIASARYVGTGGNAAAPGQKKRKRKKHKRRHGRAKQNHGKSRNGGRK